MKIRLDDANVLEFPSTQKWAEFFEGWFDSIVDSLDARFARADREDAVVGAFVKLMAKPKSEYGHVPETERDWYGNVVWQAKAGLSRMKVSRETWGRHHEKAALEGRLAPKGVSYCGIDERVRDKAAFETLEKLCAGAKMKRTNVEAYVRWHLFGEPCDKVAESYGTNPNNLYAIRYRIEKLLANSGPEVYGKIRRRLFLEVA